ncbi:hypothetical protein C7441_11089 [Pseudaminobacter salicylatoxidans]|uniref:Uncharacterized protein n=1 Tax=Pseudaminobacter salicylatoxidans TaxID=93369 RepID=A0A316C2I1_PSESE|nr:hypothetical protein [Pseudaminobacter salicylatoxidans]PWJ81557.1 hypothetical protein C7441_11089 [Pseudaminobacter salicylatoxidans]
MTDSFFSARNQVDPQVEQASTLFCSELIEASARRMTRLEGPFEAAKRLQRIADICAGAYVLPIEHWKDLGKSEKKEPEVEPEQPKSRKLRIVEAVAAKGHWFAAGMLFNMLLRWLPGLFQ